MTRRVVPGVAPYRSRGVFRVAFMSRTIEAWGFRNAPFSTLRQLLMMMLMMNDMNEMNELNELNEINEEMNEMNEMVEWMK